MRGPHGHHHLGEDKVQESEPRCPSVWWDSRCGAETRSRRPGPCSHAPLLLVSPCVPGHPGSRWEPCTELWTEPLGSSAAVLSPARCGGLHDASCPQRRPHPTPRTCERCCPCQPALWSQRRGHTPRNAGTPEAGQDTGQILPTSRSQPRRHFDFSPRGLTRPLIPEPRDDTPALFEATRLWWPVQQSQGVDTPSTGCASLVSQVKGLSLQEVTSTARGQCRLKELHCMYLGAGGLRPQGSQPRITVGCRLYALLLASGSSCSCTLPGPWSTLQVDWSVSRPASAG